MGTWKPIQNSVSDIFEWKEDSKLELTPAFQRKPVWTLPSKIMLIDSILKGIPIPKILIASKMKDGKKYRSVIDGQQRLRAIIEFVDEEYALSSPYEGPLTGKIFSDLDQDVQNKILEYNLDFNECTDFTEVELREVYSRFNKYIMPLNKQELRKAEFPGDFAVLSERLSLIDYFDDIKIFSVANRRRSTDVEYISELLSALIDGVQNKKDKLDSYYQRYREFPNAAVYKSLFEKTISEISIVFSEEYPQKKTRFKQKADFYSLFLAVNHFVKNGLSLKGKNLTYLREDLSMIDFHVHPESDVKIFRQYAINCTSKSNTYQSRKWRTMFFQYILSGSYIEDLPPKGVFLLYQNILSEVYGSKLGMCPGPFIHCPICDPDEAEEEYLDTKENYHILSWKKDSKTHQISNSKWLHKSCLEGNNEWVNTYKNIITVNEDQLSFFPKSVKVENFNFAR